MTCCMGFGATVAWQWDEALEMAPPTTATGYAACEVLDGVQPKPLAALGREGGAELALASRRVGLTRAHTHTVFPAFVRSG